MASSMVVNYSSMDTYVDDALTHLSSMEKLPELPISTVMGFQSEFRFLSLFLTCFPLRVSDANLRVILGFLVTSIADLSKIERIDSKETFNQWHSVIAKLYPMIRDCKAEINRSYRGLLISCSLPASPFTGNHRVRFLDSVLVNLNHIVDCQVDELFAVKRLFEMLEERVFIVKNLIYFTDLCRENCGECFGCCLFNVLGFWANQAACLILLHWLNELKDDDDDSVEKLRRLNIEFSPCNPEFVRLCFQVIKVVKLNHSDTLVFGEFVSRFVELFLDNVILVVKDDDDVRMIREGLILLITFLADSLANDSERSLIQKGIHAVLDHASFTICCYGEINMDLAERKATFDNLQKSIGEVRVEIEKKIYVHQVVPHPSWCNFPRTNRLGYYESLLVYLENLKKTMNKDKKLVLFLKDPIFRIHEELSSLMPFLQGISTMQDEHNDSNDLREQIIRLSYQVDLTIKSSFFIDHPIWDNLTCLSFVVREIKDIRFKVLKIESSQICKSEAIAPSMCSVDVVDTPSSIHDVVVGFKHEIEVLTDCLTCGTPRLDIVSIVGMGGIGKTTLAMKLFNEPSIIQHFHKRAFCSVTQDYVKRNVLLDILKTICQKSDDEVQQKSDDELAHTLYQSLRGCKYLIVLDDIWDINAWYDLRPSIPDDSNESRIIFTTRINNISLLAKPDSTPYLLPFLSIDESWELLHRIVFHEDPCPAHLCEVGKLIAKKCRGLPLAIVVIAGLLAKTERHLLQWNKVADNLRTIISSEGCKDIINLSYKNLPDALKSCFLYLGAFHGNEILDAKRLTLLWISEGFVLNSGSSSCLRKVAKRYMNDLGDRNLVTVTKRSCNGGIKSFRVHDLIRDFCRTKAQDEHYLCFINADNSNNLPMPSICGQYRICVEAEWRSFVDAKPEGSTVHSLLYLSKPCHEESSLQSLLHNLKFVQVLNLQEVEIVGEFPTAVTMLVHLTYLALRFFSAPYVPLEIRNLWNLETFLLFGGPAFGKTDPVLWVTVILREPHRHHINPIFSNGIWKLKRLQHLETEFSGFHVALDDVTSVSSSQLQDLETFTSLYIPSGKDGVELLRRLPNIRKLSCLFNGSWDPQCKCYRLPNLENLTKLESLKMIYIGAEVCHSEMFSFPLTIRKLTLRDFKLPWNEFSAMIGKLPCVEVLVLFKDSFSGKIWDVVDDEYSNIKSLVLVDLDIEEWKASTDSFPSLEKLVVCRCNRLIEIPPCFGEVSTLKSISVKFSEKRVVDSAIRIQNEQSDFGNQSFEVELVLNSL